MLETTIGNHDQNFLDKWYLKLKQFSLSLMEDIVQVCDKTINGTLAKIRTTEKQHNRNSPLEVFLGKGALKICSRSTGQHPYRGVISIKLLCNRHKNENSKVQFFEIYTKCYHSTYDSTRRWKTRKAKKSSLVWHFGT